MAIDGAGYSSSEFQLAFKAESTIGTANVSTMQLIDIDEISFPSLNPIQTLDVRSGTGRTAKGADAFITEKHTLKEISFSGTADTTVLPLLLQNIMTVAQGSSPASYDIPNNYTPPELETGDNSSITIADTCTVAFVSPEAGNDHSIIFPGCTLTSLSLTGDMGTESGRIKMSGTFTTAFLPSYGQSKPTSMNAFGTSYYSLTDFTTTRKVAGVADSIISSMTLNLENPSNYGGFTGSNGDPTYIVRAVPEIVATMDATIKYDDNTAGLADTFTDGTQVATELSNNGTWTSASGFGIRADYGRITSLGMSSDAAMFKDVSIKFMAHTSGDVIQVVA